MKLLAKSGVVATVVLGLLVTSVLLAPSAGTVEARPTYKKAFEKKYKSFKKVECNVCHEGEDKENRNEYGKVFGEKLAGKNVKDVKKIEKALDAAAKENGYGDKLKKGEKPAG
jgi:hypothetical protein